jgi:hypothetical protein
LNKATLKYLKVAVLVLTVVILIAGLSACSKSSATPPKPTATTSKPATTPAATIKQAAASVPPKTTVNPVASKAPTPTAIPKLNDITFSLALDKGQDYTESTTPIFLRGDQVLHMNWLVVKGGNHFHLTFSLPDGAAIAVRTDGSLAAFSATNSVAEDLTKNGSLVFRPSDNDWADGYYIFHSNIAAADAAVTVKLLYWIEG